MKQDNDANERLYGGKLDAKEILFGTGVSAPAAVRPLDAVLNKYSPHGRPKFASK